MTKTNEIKNAAIHAILQLISKIDKSPPSLPSPASPALLILIENKCSISRVGQRAAALRVGKRGSNWGSVWPKML